MAVPAEEKQEFIPTRWSLVTRLKNWDDQEGWKVFFDTYWKLIYSVALKAGLTESESEDVVQETVITVAKNLRGFQSDPHKGSFKAWLLKTTRWRIADQFRKRNLEHYAPVPKSSKEETQTGTVERIPDPNGLELDALWDEEWEKNLMDAALERVKAKVNPKHYQIFYLNVIKGMPPREVAKSLKVGLSLVYVIKFQLSRMLKKIYQELITDSD